MNREILFKAKRKDNGKWVEGGYFSEPHTEKKFIICWNSFGLGFNEFIEIKPETICQYTGLCDKNDKKIWENDIVKVSTNKGNTLCEVRYADNVAQFQLWQFTTLPRTATVLNLGNYEEKVIGNIFDNAELLEAE